MPKLYIVKTHISSPFFLDGREELDDFKVQLTYHYDKQTRQKIQSVRMRQKTPIHRDTLNFHGLHICSAEQCPHIEAMVKQADRDLKEIDESLGGEVMFIPLDMDEVGRGALYSHLLNAIKYQVYHHMFERLEEVINRKTEMSKRTRESLLRMVDQLRTINVLNDEDVTSTLNDFKKRIQDDTITPLKEELEKNLKQMQGRWAVIQF